MENDTKCGFDYEPELAIERSNQCNLIAEENGGNGVGDMTGPDAANLDNKGDQWYNVNENTEQEKHPKRKVKDSVFTNLFSNPKYLLQLYQALHPEDTETREEDLENITINNVLVNGMYNDLGFLVKDRMIILVEAQSTWSVNILLRAFLYLAKELKGYLDEKRLDLYSSAKVKIPEPELYVIYSGDKSGRPSELTFTKEFFEGVETSLDVRAKVLFGDNKDDIIGQYVTFAKVFDEQRRRFGLTRRAIVETIRICRDQNVLKEYLENHKEEVNDIMFALYDEETIMRNHDYTLAQKSREEGREELIKDLVVSWYDNGNGVDIEEIANRLQLTAEKVQSYLDGENSVSIP